MASGYLVTFEDGACVIKDKESFQKMINISMTQNKMFLLKVSSVRDFVLVAGGIDNSRIWALNC